MGSNKEGHVGGENPTPAGQKGRRLLDLGGVGEEGGRWNDKCESRWVEDFTYGGGVRGGIRQTIFILHRKIKERRKKLGKQREKRVAGKGRKGKGAPEVHP